VAVEGVAGWFARCARCRPHEFRDNERARTVCVYGRASTVRFQDRVSSRGWQRTVAEELVADHGVIVADYFDVGCSRRVPWARRPRGRALLAAVADPGRGFDAVVVGEYERAFCGRQLMALVPLLAAHGVSLWLPEMDGPVDLVDPAHRALVLLLGSAVEAGGGAGAVSGVGVSAHEIA